jgi:hypothetical protein
MQGRRIWIENGKLCSGPNPADLTPADEERRLHREGFVRLTTGDIGTEIRWSVFSPCFASLFTAQEWLTSAKPPFMLRYYLSGWFEEVISTAELARRRIDEIISKSELHIAHHTFVKQMHPDSQPLPPLLQHSFDRSQPLDEYAVTCTLDRTSQQYRVSHIGPKSIIARVYGTTPASYPCKNGGSYDTRVSEAYAQVLDTGRPRYDHVLAAFRTPDNSVHWVPYQRLIFPVGGRASKDTVSVVSEIANVDIRII